MFDILKFDYHQHIQRHFDFINESELAKRLLFIDEGFLQINQNKCQQVADDLCILSSQTDRYLVLCLESNPTNFNQYMSELSQYYDTSKLFLLMWDADSSIQTLTNQAYWPTFLINQRIENKKVDIIQPRRHRISFLSGLVRYHRLKLWSEIQSAARPEDVIVVNAICSSNFSNTILVGLESDAAILKQQISLLPWANKQEYIDQDQTGWSISNNGSTEHPAYLSCVNVTGESWYHDQNIFVTEKTWKAYRAGCLVVNYGAERMSAYLKKLGFAIWDEYDTTDNMQQRLILIKELFQRDDIEELYRQNFDMIQHNLNLFQDDKLARSLCRPAVEKLKNWVV